MCLNFKKKPWIQNVNVRIRVAVLSGHDAELGGYGTVSQWAVCLTDIGTSAAS